MASNWLAGLNKQVARKRIRNKLNRRGVQRGKQKQKQYQQQQQRPLNVDANNNNNTIILSSTTATTKPSSSFSTASWTSPLLFGNRKAQKHKQQQRQQQQKCPRPLASFSGGSTSSSTGADKQLQQTPTSLVSKNSIVKFWQSNEIACGSRPKLSTRVVNFVTQKRQATTTTTLLAKACTNAIKMNKTSQQCSCTCHKNHSTPTERTTSLGFAGGANQPAGNSSGPLTTDSQRGQQMVVKLANNQQQQLQLSWQKQTDQRGRCCLSNYLMIVTYV